MKQCKVCGRLHAESIHVSVKMTERMEIMADPITQVMAIHPETKAETVAALLDLGFHTLKAKRAE